MSVTVPAEKAALTKQGILAKLAKIYDPLGLVSPTTLRGKLIYRAVCDAKTAWDAPIPQDIAKSWRKWERGLLHNTEVPRLLVIHQEDIQQIELHSFGDVHKRCCSLCLCGYQTNIWNLSRTNCSQV